MTDQKFSAYECEGESVEYARGGFKYVVRIKRDDMTHVDDYNCYSAEDVTRWRNDEWFFCGLVVSVYVGDDCIDDHAASIWGVECNFNDNNEYLNELAAELVGEAEQSTPHIVAAYINRLEGKIRAVKSATMGGA